MATIKRDDVLGYLESANMLEISALIKDIEEKFEVTAVAPMAIAGGGPAAGEPVAEEKDEYTVVLTQIGEKKINVIKVVREITALGLKEAKTLVDGAPASVLEGVDKEAAEKAKEALEVAGATVELR